ncbi:MAG: ADP-ribosylglycohydrolase family protein [Flavobacteriaceae bacterium]|jgi:ADP-ribosylglycohydrolase|nr:ADP-ribosylglycohydrolase family protein [Flavobacteriaceae bacterium]
MLGAITGDIIGSRFEFNNHRSTDFELFTNECSFTDDTICTVAVADTLLQGISFEKSLRNRCKEYPNPKGGYGGSFAVWLQSDNPRPYKSFGNGSAMRVSPCAWFSNDRKTVLDFAKKSAECTHNHPEGIKGAMAVADCVFHAHKENRSKEKIKEIAESYGYDLDMTCAEIRRTNTFNETCQVTVPQAIICFLESTDFESAVRLAVSIGGDSDTIAAITGSIAEAFYGIPENIKQQALGYLPEEMKNVLSNFYKRIENE